MEILNYIYTEQDLIGKGGMGSVYRARHKFIEGEMAAVKVINANMITDFTRQLLQQEAENLSSLNHPNIVQSKNYHIDEKGNVYLIMEYVDGLSLDQYIRRETGLIVESRICPIFEPILDAVGYAHKRGAHGRGIMHLDIKPANIIIKKEKTSDGEEKIVPKILDFGIAQIIKTGETQNNANQPKLIMGTPSYMSPEQTKGENLDSRSDIYSLGVLLHQMLIGRPPYDTTTLSEFDINRKVMEDPLPRIKSYYEQHSTRVQKVIDKATAKDRNDRYQTCEEFKKALHEAVYPPKIPVWVKTSIAAAIAIIIGVGGWFWDYNRVKVSYYKDYVEQWGVPVGLGELGSKEHKHAERSYKFEEKRRKLLRVSHVNSLDKVIDDNESERYERPLDQEFFYSAEGKVSRVIVKDRGGKVLYVKSYNDKLNVMAFQYNDEHYTERVLANSTVGYVRLLEDNLEDKGRISRWWIEYDENGFAKTEMFHGLDNSPVCDKNHIYGRSYVRDEKGRPVEIHYVGIDGKPQPTNWGLGIKRFTYDENDNWVKAEYLTIDGQPALDDSDGVGVYVMEYDQYGNITYSFHQSHDGRPMYPKKPDSDLARAGLHQIFDENGFQVKAVYLDSENNPMFVNGCAMIDKEYDKNGYLRKMVYRDSSGEITTGKLGCASIEFVNDEHGNEIERWYRDIDGELCEISDGNAGIVQEYDSVGNRTKIVFYDKNKEPLLNKNGYAGFASLYNERNLLVEYTFLGKELLPTADNDNVVKMRMEYDKRGNQIKTTYYEADGQTLRLSKAGIAGFEDNYDENGNQTERRFFDAEGKIIVSPEYGYAICKYTYDENNCLKSYRYTDAEGNLLLANGVSGYDYLKDNQGNTLESKPIGKNGKQSDRYLLSKYNYDQFNNCIEMALFDDKGPAINNKNVHRYVYAYDVRNQKIEERHYGKDGKLVLIDDDTKCAIQRDEYDERGNRVKTAYFGTDEKPCLCKEGWSSSTYEFDVFGHVTKQCFFGVDGKPTKPEMIAPVGVAEYDKWGNMIYIATQDGEGNFINNKNDWSISRMEYDQRNNCISTSYFDVLDNPTLFEKSYHRWKAKYDNYDNLLEKCYYGINGDPVLHNGYHKEVYKYDENGQLCTEEVFFDTKGQPAMCKTKGYHKLKKEYNSDKLETLRAMYNAKGKLTYKMETTYDECGRTVIEKQTDASGTTMKAVYGYEGDSQIASTAKMYDSNGELVRSFRRDSEGNWKEVPIAKKVSPAQWNKLTQSVAQMNGYTPIDLGSLDENYEGLILTSIRTLTNPKVEVEYKTKKTKYQDMNKDDETDLVLSALLCTWELFEDYDNVDVRFIVKDNKGRLLFDSDDDK